MSANLLTTADTAKLLNLDRAGVVALLQRGVLKGRRVGRGWVVNADSVIAYQQKQNKASSG